MLNIDKQLLEIVQQSGCFGIAHDESTPECKRCDVRLQCKKRVEGADIQAPTIRDIPDPAPAKAEKASSPAKKEVAPKPKAEPKAKANKATKPAKRDVKYSDDMPADWKPMTLGELKNLAVSREVTWTEYDSEQITRMRLIMALKKSYELS